MYHKMFPFCPDIGEKIQTEHTLITKHELHVESLFDTPPPQVLSVFWPHLTNFPSHLLHLYQT